MLDVYLGIAVDIYPQSGWSAPRHEFVCLQQVGPVVNFGREFDLWTLFRLILYIATYCVERE